MIQQKFPEDKLNETENLRSTLRVEDLSFLRGPRTGKSFILLYI